MSAEALLETLSARGVDVAVEGGRLRVRAARGLIDGPLKARIAEQRDALVALLIERDDPLAPFPLTDIQQAYLVGRTPGWPLGQIACHAYSEFDGAALDPARMAAAWTAVIDRHPSLRTRMTTDGRQQVQPEAPPWSIAVHDLRGAAADAIEAHLTAVRDRLAVRNADPHGEALFAIELTLLPGDRMRTHLDFDMIAIDASGIGVAINEWGVLYGDPDATLPPPAGTFRDAVLRRRAQRATAEWRGHEAWWLERLETLPPCPDLPLATDPDSLSGMRADRLAARLDPDETGALLGHGRRHRLTPTAVVGAAFADVLAAWSDGAPFTLDLTLFRPPLATIGAGPLAGEFTSTVLLEVDPSPPTFAERARALRDRLAADFEHIDCSGVAAARAYARKTGITRHFPVVFTSMLNDRPSRDGEVGRWLGTLGYRVTQTPQVWLDHQAWIDDGALHLAWDAPRGLFPAGMLEAAFGAYVDHLRGLARDDAWTADRAPLLPADQRARRAAYNRSAGPTPEGRLFDGFRAMADGHPERIAVIGADATLDYRALDARANQISAALRACAPAVGDPIVVCLPRGAAQVAAVLGVHGVGAAYVPLDSDWPQGRIIGMAERCGARLVLTDAARAAWPWPAAATVIDVASTVDRPTTRSPAPQGPADRAYIIHTSGSTGAPKGVVMSHSGTLETVADLNRRFEMTPRDRVLSLASLAFDLSVYDIFGLLAAGGAVVMPDAARARDVHHWIDLIERARVSVWSTVPALFELLVEVVERRRARGEGVPGDLRVIMLSGDWIPTDLPDRARALWPEARVYGFGGATEAAIWSCIHDTRIQPPDMPSVPYGTPLANQRLYVLDRFLRPCPAWVPGEIHIGGAGLADGYWRDPDQTADRFVVHPRTGERLYRTGDHGRFRPTGPARIELEFLGRRDRQVKVNGVRIELGEIEAALRAQPGVRDAVVDAPGDRQRRTLVAYVVADDPAAPPADEALQRALDGLLPAAVVPRHYRAIDAVPLNANGKVDRGRLPAFEPSAEVGAAPEERLDDGALARVLDVIARVMPGLVVGPDDELVRAGANSVDLIRLGARLNDVFGSRPPMVEVLRQGTPAALARFYARSAPAEAAAPAVQLITDPAAREAHKALHLAQRPVPATARPLHRPAANPGPYLDRASQRSFGSAPLSAEALGAWLSVLCPLELDGRHRYRTGSAGGIYPLRTYVFCQPGAVVGLPTGAWYHDPLGHRLAPVGPGRAVLPEMHTPSNRPWVEAAPLLLFFVVEKRAIEPLYGERWRDFALIEIGARAQVLEDHALDCGVGACQLGDIDHGAIGAVLGLDESEVLLHAMAAGPTLLDDEMI